MNNRPSHLWTHGFYPWLMPRQLQSGACVFVGLCSPVSTVIHHQPKSFSYNRKAIKSIKSINISKINRWYPLFLVTSPFAMLKSPLFMVKSTFFMVELLIFPVKSLSPKPRVFSRETPSSFWRPRRRRDDAIPIDCWNGMGCNFSSC